MSPAAKHTINVSSQDLEDFEYNYKTWRMGRVFKILFLELLGILILLVYIDVHHLPPRIGLAILEMAGIIVLLNLVSMCHELQTTSQNDINRSLPLSDGEKFHLLEIFPGKGIRLLKKELRKRRREEKNVQHPK